MVEKKRCTLDGVIVIHPDAFEDSRGMFMEAWNKRKYEELGVADEFVQDNVSCSKKDVLRGLHYQNPNPQGKLVTVLQGEVLDVVVDVRLNSATFGKWEAFVLSDRNKTQVFIPPGFAHGFVVRSDAACFFYKCTAPYSPASEVTIRWDDPSLGIEWGTPNPIVSPKDAKGRRLSELPREMLFTV